MGCNTSKQETVAPASDEDNAQDKEENRDSGKDGNKESKPESAKTITLTSNGAVLSSSSRASSGQPDQNHQGDLEGAATKIQAAFRGHQTRKSVKHGATKASPGASTPERRELNSKSKKTPENSPDLSQAATKIQASFRGHLTRKQMEKKDNASNPPKDRKNNEAEEELDIDLTDPELNKAAVKIQASFRGHLTRKDIQDEPEEPGKDEKK